MQDKVLIIEDSRSFALLLQKLLLDHTGLQSDVATSKEEASLLIHAQGNTYFAAIVDLNLPDAPNGEATELVVRARIPAVVFTSTNDQAIKADLWARGIADYAHKSGSYSLDYICWIIDRLKKNGFVKILVVEPSMSTQQQMSKLLKTHRFQVFCATNNAEALALLDAYPDICVSIIDSSTDNGLDAGSRPNRTPNTSSDFEALELISKMRESRDRNSLEVIGVTGQSSRSVSAQFIKSGANDILLKPLIPEEFLCRINHAVDRVESFEKLTALNHTKNQLIGTAAHDIRGPVGAIKTAADYIVNRQPPEKRQRALLKMIESSASGLLDLLGDLLDVSAIEGGELNLNISDINISALIEERMNLYMAQAEAKRLKMSIVCEPNIQADIDPVKTRQVVDNLLTNAIKYSPEAAQVQVSLTKHTKTIRLCVEDSGPGISADEQKDLFKPFTVLSTKTTGGEISTGLGLAIVKHVVQAHSGKIYYQDSELGGAGFVIELPISVN